jgi:hypothetical protein
MGSDRCQSFEFHHDGGAAVMQSGIEIQSLLAQAASPFKKDFA